MQASPGLCSDLGKASTSSDQVRVPRVPPRKVGAAIGLVDCENWGDV